MAQLAFAGIDYRLVLRATDPVEVYVAQAVAERVIRFRSKIETDRADVLARNIGTHTANKLGPMLGRLVKSMLESMRGG